MLIWPLVAIVAGLIILVWSSDRFVYGAAALAHNFGVPHLIIGVTIVSLGTSAPEILVAANASLSDSVGLAMGNALGSNIANIGLVLGITALIAPLPISRRVMKVENLVLLAVTLLAGYFIYDLIVERSESILLLLSLFVFLFWIFKNAKENDQSEFDDDIPNTMSNVVATIWFVVGLVLLVASSRLLVWGAVEVARALNISELIIGATIVAIGTSLPELAASVTSALKGHHDIAIGNVLGSNIFNLLAVAAVPGLLNPTALSTDLFWRDYLSMLFLTSLLCLGLLWRGSSGRPLGRVFGLLVLGLYSGYLYINYLAIAN